MHRIVAMLLMAVLGISGAGAGVFADAAAKVPACCRRGGKHHCTSPGEATSGPALQSARCPSFPVAQSTPPITIGVSTARAAVFGLVVAERPSLAAPVVLAHSFHRTDPSRGPPSA
jgi:hypothetical protein